MQNLPLGGFGELTIVGVLALFGFFTYQLINKYLDRRPKEDNGRKDIIQLYQASSKRMDDSISKLEDELKEVSNDVKATRSSTARQEGYLKTISETLIKIKAQG